MNADKNNFFFDLRHLLSPRRHGGTEESKTLPLITRMNADKNNFFFDLRHLRRSAAKFLFLRVSVEKLGFRTPRSR